MTLTPCYFVAYYFTQTGEEAEDRQTKLMKVEPTPEITYHLLSMSMADDEDEDISETNVGGFLCVQAVDMEKRVSF